LRSEVLLEKLVTLFRLAEVEGEDLTLNKLYKLFNLQVPLELKELEDLPPRLALTLIHEDPRLRGVVRKAAKAYLREKKVKI